MLNFHTQGGAPVGAERASSPADLSRTKLSVSLRPNALPADLLLLVLQAAHLRRLCSSSGGAASPGNNEAMLKQSLAAARQDIKPFVQVSKSLPLNPSAVASLTTRPAYWPSLTI